MQHNNNNKSEQSSNIFNKLKILDCNDSRKVESDAALGYTNLFRSVNIRVNCNVDPTMCAMPAKKVVKLDCRKN